MNSSTYEHELKNASYVIDFTTNPTIPGRPAAEILLEALERSAET
jgi:hypothetical protein